MTYHSYTCQYFAVRANNVTNERLQTLEKLQELEQRYSLLVDDIQTQEKEALKET